VIREVEAGGHGFSPEIWNEMAGLGWLGIDIPEHYRGAGAGLNQAVQYMVSDILIDMHRADLLNRQAALPSGG
jgi:alkylation response protein AidB-like acyl-CoA dehydrogenase